MVTLATKSQGRNRASGNFQILCLSHLIWEKQLFQRPQQLMTRFEDRGHEFRYLSLMASKRWLKSTADERTVPVGDHGKAINVPHIPFQKILPPLGHLTRYRFASRCREFFPKKRTNHKTRVLWVQHPAYVCYMDELDYDVLVYDCMDPFKSFKAKQPRLLEYEEQLLGQADVVFSGGRSLHKLVEDRNPNAHCFPSGIDFPHFAKGAEEGNVPEDIRNLKQPVLGYFGAIDERIDWDLTRKLCQANPDWSVVFLGPLIMMDQCPIDEPNFHWLGPKKYDSLPDYLRAFTVSLIPWLVNDLTSFMSPTKTPEYLAAGTPVVSVPIPDVVTDYSNDALIAENTEDFIAFCRKAVEEGKGPSLKPEQSRTWDEIAEGMEKLILEVLDRK